jgi:hypothetical protein
LTQFSGTASADSATFTNSGTSQLGEATGGTTEFLDDSTAAQGTFINDGGLTTIAHAGMTIFRGNCTAGTGSFTNNQGALISFNGEIDFYDNASVTMAFLPTTEVSSSTTARQPTGPLSSGPQWGGVVALSTPPPQQRHHLFEDGGVVAVGSASLGNA